MKRRAEDRRRSPRFEIVGELWGTLDTVVAMRLLDIGRGGALVQSQVSLTPPCVYHVRVDRGAQRGSARVEVRHAHQVVDSRGQVAFLIGLDFLSMPPDLRTQIGTWLARARFTDGPRPDAVERRRTPRARPGDEHVYLELQHRVRLLDLSQSGALMASEASLPVGTKSHFRTILGELPFDADIEVKRQQESPQSSFVSLGSMFTAVDDNSMRALERCLQYGQKRGS